MDTNSGTDALDRAVGALLGLACGDAVGTTLEFRRPGTFAPIDDMVGGGPFRLEPGAWTDDTSMALCLAESLLDTGAMDLADQLRRYVLWWRTGYLSSTGRCFDIGNATRSELSRFERTGEAVNPVPDEEAAANGSLMRLAPVAIRWHGDVAEASEMAAESSRSTHAATRPVDACRVLGAMTAALIGGAPADEVLAPEFWRWGALHPEIEAVARGSWREQGAAGHPRHGVLRRRPGGGVVGGRRGVGLRRCGAPGGQPRRRRRHDGGDRRPARRGAMGSCRHPASDGASGWSSSRASSSWRPGCSAPDSVDPPVAKWPHDDYVHAWWVEPGTVLAGEYPGDRKPGVAAARVNLLVDAGIRTFVDLTTPEDRLEPYAAIVAAAASNRGLDLRHCNVGIPDFSVSDDATYDELVDLIRRESGRGGVFVHCWGGIGRTGTVVGCLLAAEGLGYDGIVERLAALREGTRKSVRPAPEADSQHEVLRRRSASALVAGPEGGR